MLIKQIKLQKNYVRLLWKKLVPIFIMRSVIILSNPDFVSER